MSDKLTMDRLEESLRGVFDLTKAEDCRKVMQTLVRDLNMARDREAKAAERLRTLALMVLNYSPDAQRTAREVVVDASKERGNNAMAFLLEMAEEMGLAKDMPDEKLVGEVLDKVWGSFDMRGRESALVGELVGRFQEARIRGMGMSVRTK